MSAAAAPKVTIVLKRPYAMLALGVAMFLGGGWFMLREAQTNDRGLIINGIITLEPGGADVFYVVMGLLSLAMGALSVVALVGMATRKEFRVVLGRKAVLMPHGRVWQKGELEVPYASILGVAAHPPGKPTFVILETKEGRRYLSARYLPAQWPAPDVAKAIVDRWRTSRTQLG